MRHSLGGQAADARSTVVIFFTICDDLCSGKGVKWKVATKPLEGENRGRCCGCPDH